MLRLTATIGVEQNSPILTPGVANRAPSAAIARSHVATSWQPADALDGGDHRLRDALDRLHHPRADVEDLPLLLQRAPDQLAQVVARREGGAVRPQHDGADLGPGALALQLVRELAHERGRERVALLGPVERDEDGREGVLRQQVLQDGCHGSLIPRRRPSSVAMGALATLVPPWW